MDLDFEGENESEEGGLDVLQGLKADLISGMRAYLADMLDGGGEAGYSGADIGACGRILDAYLARIEAAPQYDREEVMAAVQEATIALNELNARCNGGLIETDQREQICEVIIQAAATRGVGAGEDLTEAWRDW